MSSTLEFYKQDFPSTLFPLNTNLILIENYSQELSQYIYEKVINTNISDHSFLSQQKVFATKPKNHLRRTVKLDPVAEYFIYDLVYRNRSKFREAVSDNRLSFGYRFKNGKPITVHEAYEEFKSNVNLFKLIYKHYIKFDIASYFNCLYHHDVCHWFSSKGISQLDSDAFGQFCREINSGRSVDFMPHGIYPSKMIGNEFLKFIDLNNQLKSEKIIRFMDDFFLFDDDLDVLNKDFIKIQKLIGNFGLNINPAKTSLNSDVEEINATLSNVKKTLETIVTISEECESASGISIEEIQRKIVVKLNSNQINQLLNLLKNEQIEETDAELILSFLRSNSDDVIGVLPNILEKFPNLIKQVYFLSSTITDKNSLSKILLQHLNSDHFFLEYELFWIAKIVEDFLLKTPLTGELLIKIFEFSDNYKISQAKILEIPINDFGLKELRSDFLKTGQSDWLAWSSAIGSRGLQVAERNYVLDYFSKASPINYLIASCVKKL